MPTIAQSAMMPAGEPATPKPAPQGATTLVPSPAASMSAFFHCSMPVMASTFDSLTRQYYGRNRAPQTRILPVTP